MFSLIALILYRTALDNASESLYSRLKVLK